MATVPNPPTTPRLSNITAASVVVTFTNGSDGGDTIDLRQIGYSQLPQVPNVIVTSDGSTTVSGLAPGKTYYFWARTHNSQGFSAWSGKASGTMLQIPDAPSTPQLASVTATTVDVSFTPNDNGGSPIDGYQIGYGLSGLTQTFIVFASSPRVITGLTPGAVWFFRARAHNIVGWSPWSGAASVRTVAGAYIKVGTAWKLAVPYVRVGGVWKPAEAWSRSVGEWKRTI